MLFIKPKTALYNLQQPLTIPSNFNSIHHKIKLTILINTTLHQTTKKHIHKTITNYNITLNLTLHNIQKKIKKTKQP